LRRSQKSASVRMASLNWLRVNHRVSRRFAWLRNRRWASKKTALMGARLPGFLNDRFGCRLALLSSVSMEVGHDGESTSRGPWRRGLMTAAADSRIAVSPSTQIRWDATSRVAFVHYSPGAVLKSSDGTFLAETLTGWIARDREPFGVLADADALGGTDAEYRAKASRFFREHRGRAFIALIHVGPLIHIVVEMFRVGTGIPLKTFPDEITARAWLRTKGIAA
jgi:hypothetical protein